MKKILLMVLSLSASLSVFAQEADALTPAVTYTYGMQLDIAEVIHMSPDVDVCGPVSAQMTYRNSQGEIHVLNYRKHGTGCRG